MSLSRKAILLLLKTVHTVRTHDRSFTFTSNLEELLAFMHAFKYVLQHENSTLEFVTSCIEPLIKHLDDNLIGSAILSFFKNNNFHNNIKQIISAVFIILHQNNSVDNELNKLLLKYSKRCMLLQPMKNITTHQFSLEDTASDILSHILSFLSPKQLRIIQRVSYSFYAALQKPAANVVLNGDLLFKIVLYRTRNMPTAKDYDLHPQNIRVLSKYSMIKDLSISLFTLIELTKYFNYAQYLNLEAFWNQFCQIERLEICEIETIIENDNHSIDKLLESMINSKCLSKTLKHLKLIENENYQNCFIVNISEKTLAYFQKFVNLKSLYFEGYIALIGNLEDVEYINDHYLKLQSYIKHIDDISIGCDHIHDSITPQFLALFFHSNIDSLLLKLGSDDGFDNFVDEIEDLHESGMELLGLTNLNNLKKFNLYTDPTLMTEENTGLWTRWMINNMHNLDTFKISQWNKCLIFGDIQINDINMDNNILYKVLLNNINSLENIFFVHDMEYTEQHGLNENAWFPLFLIYNILMNGMNEEHINNWLIGKFKKFEFYLIIGADDFYDDDEYMDRFNELKLSLFNKVEIVIREIKRLFIKYNINYSIKLWLQPKLMELYSAYFKVSKQCGNELILRDDKQRLITDYLHFVSS